MTSKKTGMYVLQLHRSGFSQTAHELGRGHQAPESNVAQPEPSFQFGVTFSKGSIQLGFQTQGNREMINLHCFKPLSLW